MSKSKQDLSAFKEGQLCYLVLRRYRGTGPMIIIAHEAMPTPGGGFGYGCGKTWTIKPSQLMGMSRSEAKSKASKANGPKGGRPKSKRNIRL